MAENEILILAETTHTALKLEDRLEKRGIMFKTVAKPRSLGTDCGIGMMLEKSLLSEVLKVIETENMQIHGIYERHGSDWMECVTHIS